MTQSTTDSTTATTDPTATTDATSTTNGASTGGAGTGFRRPITVASGTVTEDLTNFVMLMLIEGEDSLRHVDNGGNVATMNGSDLSFRDDAGSALEWELVGYRPGVGALIAWVRVPTIATASDTTIYLHYGDANDIITPDSPWDDYLAVYHFEDPLQNNGNVLDSGPNGIHGTASDLNSDDAVAGKIGRGFRFQDDDDAVVLSSSVLDDAGPMSIVAWARMDGNGSGFGRIYHKGGYDQRQVELYVEDDGTLIWRLNADTDFPNNTTCSADPPTFSQGEFHHYVGVADNANAQMRLYFDGNLVDSDPWVEPPIDGGFDDTYIGNWHDQFGDRWWNGVIDEVHVYDGAVTDAWVAATHANTDAPSTFFTLGAEEAL
jgi:hypothetical protein